MSRSTFHVDKRITSLEITGGKQCTNKFSTFNPDLIVYGGAHVGKQSCFDDNVRVKGDFTVDGNLITQSIINADPNNCISIIGNLCIDGCLVGDQCVDGNLTVLGDVISSSAGKVKISSTDSVLDFLENKLVAGNAITLTTIPGISEQIRIDGLASNDGWLYDGNSVLSTKYIGTNTNFDFPINTNGLEVARFSTDARLFMGASTALHGSNAGIQYSTLTANRAQLRGNQYGANSGVPGITSFKSRGTSIGTLAPVQAGDIIYGATGIGVTPGNLIPLSFLSRAVVSFAGASWIATDYQMSLVPLAGPTNGVRQVFGVSSEGMLRVRETANSMAGVVPLDGAGQAVVANSNIKATSRFTLTVQDNTGGPTVPPTGNIYVSTRVVGTSFTILSTSGAADSGVIIYYQIWEQAV